MRGCDEGGYEAWAVLLDLLCCFLFSSVLNCGHLSRRSMRAHDVD